MKHYHLKHIFKKSNIKTVIALRGNLTKFKKFRHLSINKSKFQDERKKTRTLLTIIQFLEKFGQTYLMRMSKSNLVLPKFRNGIQKF